AVHALREPAARAARGGLEVLVDDAVAVVVDAVARIGRGRLDLVLARAERVGAGAGLGLRRAVLRAGVPRADRRALEVAGRALAGVTGVVARVERREAVVQRRARAVDAVDGAVAVVVLAVAALVARRDAVARLHAGARGQAAGRRRRREVALAG